MKNEKCKMKNEEGRRPLAFHLPFFIFHFSFFISLLTAAFLAMCDPAFAADTAPDAFVNNACVQCHRHEAGRSAEIVNLEWQPSVHYGANVGCNGCHGGNPSVRREQYATDDALKKASHQNRVPDFLLMYRKAEGEFVPKARGREVSYFCGKCHADIKEKHLGSPHGDFGDPTCLYCHGQGSHNHKIVHPTTDIIDTRSWIEGGRCGPCHKAATMETVARIKKILIDTEQGVITSARQYDQLEHEWGYHNLELEKMNHHAKETQSKLRQIFHSFNMREINEFAGEIQQVVDRTQATHEMIQRLRQTQRQQTCIGIAAVALLLLFAGLLVYYKGAFLEEK